jgi:hypothetical protein
MALAFHPKPDKDCVSHSFSEGKYMDSSGGASSSLRLHAVDVSNNSIRSFRYFMELGAGLPAVHFTV